MNLMNLAEFQKNYNYALATPVMQQYLDMKFDHQDCLLLFRMGDFYELFYEDAVIASRALGVTLTKRGKSGDDEIQMCGIPFHALDNYLYKLLEENFKVAVCEQTETPEEAKKRGGYKAVVAREITRIITPGTITEDSLLSSNVPNYLASIVISSKEAAICYLDLSTSRIAVIEVPVHDMLSELSRINPTELLATEKMRSSELALQIEAALKIRISFQVDSFFAEKKCLKIIENYYHIASIAAIGELSSAQVSAIGSVLEYVSLTQKANLPKLPMPKIINYGQFMLIDQATRRNLELVSSLQGTSKGSLFSVINHTVTKGGARLLYEYINRPLLEINKINARLEITDFFFKEESLTTKIRHLLAKTNDLERCLTRIQMQRSCPHDLLAIKDTITFAEQIRAELVELYGINLPEVIKKLVTPLIGNSDIIELIDQSIQSDAPNTIAEGGVINESYHPKIKELRDLLNNSRNYVERLKEKYKQDTGIDSLKISNNNVIGLFIDITTRHSSKMNNPVFIHRQTTANSIRYTTVELQELESKIINARAMLISLEKEIYSQICQEILAHFQSLNLLAESLKRLDVLTNFAFSATEFNYTRPQITDGIEFDINEGRHPVVEKFLKSENHHFTPNNCNLDQNNRIWLLTGPNMAGKSTFLRQNALIAILAQIGSFVPAKSASIGVIDKLFSRIGAGDDLTKGQSTFMVEMLETAAILSQSTNRSFIILDEVGRGTATYDGVAIAWSVVEYVHDKIKARCLFATHYHELTSLSDILPSLENYTISIAENEGKILFLHKIIKGFADRSYGVHVAQLAGLPASVIKRANQLLAKFEKESKKSNKATMKTESNNLSLFS